MTNKLLSGNGLILSAAVLFTGIASAGKQATLDSPHNLADNVRYTASGKMDMKTAMMLQNLLKNPHLQTHVQIGRTANQAHRAINDTVNPTYTASGKMNVKTAIMLKNLLKNPHLQTHLQIGSAANNKARSSSSYSESPTYTASGTTDIKTAMMLKNLLRNPHLQVQAHVQRAQPRRVNRLTEVTVNYTIKGKTDRQTVLKLKKLLQNSKYVKISAQANIYSNQQRVSQRAPYNSQGLQNHPTYYYPGYTPFYYYGTPPVYVQGSTVWYPVAIGDQKPHSQMLAGK